MKPDKIGSHQATNEAVVSLLDGKTQCGDGLILCTIVTTHNGPYIEQCTDFNSATLDMVLRWDVVCVVQAASPNWASSGHARGCSTLIHSHFFSEQPQLLIIGRCQCTD